MTCLMGMTFLGFQAYEFTSFVHEGLTIRTQPVRLDLLHAHRLPRCARDRGCLLALLAARPSTTSAACSPSDALNVDIAALYWHFVDVVWIVIFTLIYLIK